MPNNELQTQCCIVGGGPAGMMLGFLLARAGVNVVVLEKHGDFFRDFRGDTIHPSTLQLMHELGLLDEFLKVPHQEIAQLNAVFNGQELRIADFTHLPVAKPVLGLMPQWDFLEFIKGKALKYSTFKLLVNANATDIIKTGERITGVVAETKDGNLTVQADLVVGTDGRKSTMRQKAGLKTIESGAPIDVLWFRFSHQTDDPEQSLGRFDHGRIMILLNRETYWQCAFVIDKGGFEKIKQDGLPAFYQQLTEVSPFLKDRTDELKSWNDIKLLSVEIDHLETWYTEGLLCIGDAAHAMSPIGGVGINLALQDAVAAANLLYKPLQQHQLINEKMLRKVQKRRAFPVKVIQFLQVNMQKGIMSRRSSANTKVKPPFIMRLLNKFPLLQRLPARLIGLGVRPKHIKSPEKI